MKNVPFYQNSPKAKEDLQRVIDFLKIINESNRLKILCFLRQGEQCVCAIWKFLDTPQNLTSHHLKVLKDFNLITSRQEGRNVLYSSNKEVIEKYTSFLANFLTSNL